MESESLENEMFPIIFTWAMIQDIHITDDVINVVVVKGDTNNVSRRDGSFLELKLKSSSSSYATQSNSLKVMFTQQQFPPDLGPKKCLFKKHYF